ncbi:lipopolysaccharide heptosyltransferase family protein [Sphingobacteriales bacterium UPWRP_1]|nr:hypothetical protein B6N25_03045 [Sphingobacteriales bacterium TSM_CSS]PSJ76031.1 lipopolysaccharide heptosyltransferase family protein [Sphingobacteriales bacterium UPWRP_1]
MKILLSGYTGLGNFVLKTPMLQAWKTLYPDDEIHLIAGNSFGAEYLLQHSPIITQTHILPQHTGWLHKWRFFWQLRRQRFDVLLLPFDAQPNFLVAGSYISGIKRRIRHLHPTLLNNRLRCAATLLLNPATHFVAVPPGRHETELNTDLLCIYHGKPVEPRYPTMVALPPATHVLQRFNLTNRPYLLLQPGAANGVYRAKVWPTAHFVTLIGLLQNHFGNQYQIVLCGDEGDLKHSVKPLLQLLPDAGNNLVNTAGQTSLPDLLQLINHAALVICHDSGVMHIADALQKPLIALYGPTDFTRTKPLKPTSRILFSQTPYLNAMFGFAKTEADLEKEGVQQQAMEALSPQAVFRETVNLLNKKE